MLEEAASPRLPNRARTIIGVTAATFAMARALRSRGHEVVYFTDVELARQINANGFDAVVVPSSALHLKPRLIRNFPHTGLLSSMRSWLAGWPFRAGRRPLFWLFRPFRRLLRIGRRMQCYNEVVALEINKRTPQIALIDVVRPWSAVPFIRCGAKIISINPSYTAPVSLRHPHALSTRTPRFSTRTEALLNLIGLGPLLPSILKEYFKWYLKYAAVGFSLSSEAAKQGRRLVLHEYGLRLNGPELVIMPRSVDYASANGPQRCYAGTCVDTERMEVDFDWDRLRPGAPLAYCSFGMLTPERAHSVVRAIVEAFASRPHWDVLLAMNPPRLGTATPPWIHFQYPAPQLAALRRASLFITHGGGGGMREALFAGVPMIALPMKGCEFGHSARIAFHGLGRTVTAGHITGAQLGMLIGEVTSSRTIAEAAALASEPSRSRAELDDAIRFLELQF